MLFKNLKCGAFFKFKNYDNIYVVIPTTFSGGTGMNINTYSIGSDKYNYTDLETDVIVVEAKFSEKKNYFKDVQIMGEFYITCEISNVGPSEIFMKLDDADKNVVSLNNGKLRHMEDDYIITFKDDYMR
jgi:hypothetical protein